MGEADELNMECVTGAVLIADDRPPPWKEEPTEGGTEVDEEGML
jgi:hypothetical protein